MLELITENVPASIIVFIISFSGLVEIVPVKLNPLSYLAGKIGRALNKEVFERLDTLQSDLSKHTTHEDEKWAKQNRLRILRFNDELIQGKRHTKEHFDEILDDINAYEYYCETHPEYKNNKAVLAIENVERIYRLLESENGFL